MKFYFELFIFTFLIFSTVNSVNSLSYALVRDSEGDILEKIYFDENKTVKVLKINTYCSYQKFIHGRDCEIFLEEDHDVVFASDTPAVSEQGNTSKPEPKFTEVTGLQSPQVPQVVSVKKEAIQPKVLYLPKRQEFVATGKKTLLKNRGLTEIVQGNNRVTVAHGLSAKPEPGYCFAYSLERKSFNVGNIFIEESNSETITIGTDFHVPLNHSGTSAETNLPNKVKIFWRCE